jgi:peptidoglycan/LPS O-acetylase OafA/YrhL
MQAAEQPVLAKPQSLVHRREIDGLRALAVLAVVAYHASAPTSAHQGPAGFGALGARGVDLFFVISGFCLSWPYAPMQKHSAATTLTFLRRRFTRIAPSCWVALALFVFLSWTPFGLPASEFPNVSAHDTTIEIVRDALFFPTLSPIHDPPMWTLGLEMRWYVLFVPLLLLFFRSRAAFVCVGALFYVAYAHIGMPDCGVLPTFMLGIIAAALAKSPSKFNAAWLVIAPLALGAAIFEQLRSPSIDHGDPLWAFASFALVAAVSTSVPLRRAFAWPPLVAVGVASYSIYLVHAPFMNAFIDMGVAPVSAAIASVALGFAFWFLVERTLCSSPVRRAMDASMVRVWRALLGKHATLPAAAAVEQNG